VALISRHGSSSDIVLAVVVGHVLVRIVVMGRGRLSRGRPHAPPSTELKDGPFG